MAVAKSIKRQIPDILKKQARFGSAFFLKVTLVKTKKFTQSRSLSFRKARKTDSIPLRILRFFFSLRETILMSFHSCW
jgi:hypothetical protein